jgi:hypothetical protein
MKLKPSSTLGLSNIRQPRGHSLMAVLKQNVPFSGTLVAPVTEMFSQAISCV